METEHLLIDHYNFEMKDQPPSRAYVASVYFRRVIRWRRNSSPFISGDAFSDAADITINPPNFRNFRSFAREMSDARIIFCPSRYLAEFLHENKNKLTCKIMIAGNDDTEFHEELSDLPRGLKRIYLQNSFISDDRFIFTLPIGIENFRYGVNGHPKLMKRKSNQDVSDRILFGPFSNTHPDRAEVQKYLSENVGPWDLIEHRVKPLEFVELMSGYKFVGAVRGNGIDTHRLWEALYRDTFPIVKADLWSLSLKRLELPIAYVNSWNANELRDRVNEHHQSLFKSNLLPALWMKFWEAEFKSLL